MKSTLRTVFAKVTAILNSRPICLSSDDRDDLAQSLRTIFLYKDEPSLYLPVSSLK